MTVREIIAEISGYVWKIETQEGAKVEENDTLIILESMKMEIPILAPEDGTVKEIRVKTGETVNEGAVVALLEIE